LPREHEPGTRGHWARLVDETNKKENKTAKLPKLTLNITQTKNSYKPKMKVLFILAFLAREFLLLFLTFLFSLFILTFVVFPPFCRQFAAPSHLAILPSTANASKRAQAERMHVLFSNVLHIV